MKANKYFLKTTIAVIIVTLTAYVSQATAVTFEARIEGGNNNDVEQHLSFADEECLAPDVCPPDALTPTEFRWMEGNSSSDLELGFNRPPPAGAGEPGNNQQIIGVRWENVNIPSGSIITAAYIQFSVNEEDKDIFYDASAPFLPLPGPTMILRIQGEDEDDAVVYLDKGDAGSPGSVEDRADTTELVDWTVERWSFLAEQPDGSFFPTNLGLEIPEARTPDLSDIVQEIMDRPGWDAGNSLAFTLVLAPTSDLGVNRTANSWSSFDTDVPFPGDGGFDSGNFSGNHAPLLHIEYVPEPTSLALGSLGLMGLLAVRRRRR